MDAIIKGVPDMATATATGFMGADAATGNKTTHTTIGQGAPLNRVKRALTRGMAGRMERNRILALTGSAVGAVSKAFNDVSIYHVPGGRAGNPILGGGARSVVTVVRNNTVTTAADLSQVDGVIGSTSRPVTYPTAKGHSGPGKPGVL